MAGKNAPNIIVVFPDQLRRDALGIYGDQNVDTPHIDALARRGTRFTQACSTYPICVPFRFSLMTGEYAHSRFVPGIEFRMSPAERTLADEFNDAGYESIYVGKWHLYGGHALLPNHSTLKANRMPVPPLHQGRWQKWLGFELRNGPFDTCYFEDDDPTPRPIEQYQTDGLFDLAMNYIEHQRDDEKPFCCVISTEPPHFPYEAPADLTEKWRGRDITLPDNFMVRDAYSPQQDGPPPAPDRENTLEKRRLYYAMTENLDQNMGRLHDWLARTGLDENTIVVFFSDHGEMGGSHGISPQAKDYPYEESIGIPLIVYDPTSPASHGRVLETPTCTEDLFPTLVGLAHRKTKNDLPGTNLAPLIRAETDALQREGVMLEYVHDLRPGHTFHGQYYRGFRTARYKYAVLGGVEGGEPWLLFDLETDPHEMHNRVNDPAYADVAAHMHRLLRDRLIETTDHYILNPAFGCDGLNQWQQTVSS